MNERYLWDRSGEPDPEIKELERTLAPLRLGATARIAQTRAMTPARSPWIPVAAAAAIVLAAAGLSRLGAPAARNTEWQMAGAPIRQGQVVHPGHAGAVLEADSVGRVDVAAGSEVVASGGKRLQLRRGELEAFIWAPAREFVVDTPSSRAVDLGCRYTLKVDDKGDGLLRVSMGWVAFEKDGREAFIPAGAQCRTRKSNGPGVPWFENSTEGFRAALDAWENGRAGALDGVLREAGNQDGLTLWHLLVRTAGHERERVFERLSALVSLPARVTREGVLRGEAASLDGCWDALGLQNTSWWRGWERRWQQ